METKIESPVLMNDSVAYEFDSGERWSHFFPKIVSTHKAGRRVACDSATVGESMFYGHVWPSILEPAHNTDNNNKLALTHIPHWHT